MPTPTNLTARERRLIAAFRALDKEGRRRALAVLENAAEKFAALQAALARL